MATINKSLTTYLPSQSVEWLERYCLDYKHLQNKDGNPKLGTAVADIIARLADGELALPEKIEPQSTSPLQYGTELETMKGEVEGLKKLIAEYGTNKLPDTVLDLESVKREIEEALEPIKESVSELETYTQSQFAAVRDELKAIVDRAVEMPVPVNTPTIPHHRNPQAISYPEWVKKDEKRFYSLLVDNSELLDKVAEAIDSHPKDNASLATSLFELGIHKQDGTVLDSSTISRIKSVTKQLKITPESPLPLFPTND